MKPSALVDALSAVHLDAVFNPYRDVCPVHDRADAPKRRHANLRAFLETVADEEVDSIWLARDLGYRGGRQTGLPLTDEIHLQTFREIYGVSISRATKGPPMAERTAAIVWKVLTQIDRPIFLWNVFPLHPFKTGDPLSNRRHTRAERDMFHDILLTLMQMLQPRRLVAIGRDAQQALSHLDLASTAVRHPSYGGQKEFIHSMCDLYGVRCTASAGR